MKNKLSCIFIFFALFLLVPFFAKADCPAGQHAINATDCVPDDDWSMDAGSAGGDPNVAMPVDYSAGVGSYSTGTVSSGGITGYLDEIRGATGIPDAPGGVEDVLTNFLSWMLGIFGILSVLAFVISGVLYLVSTGNPQRIDRAKSAMTWSIVGIAVGLGGVIIIETIDTLLNVW